MNYLNWIVSSGYPNNYWVAYREDTTYVDITISWIKEQINVGKPRTGYK